MKLSQIHQSEPTVKHSVALKQSTTTNLTRYQEFYKAQTGVAVTFKDIVEQMLIDFMKEDKAFQRFLLSAPEPASKAPAQQASVAPVSGEATEN